MFALKIFTNLCVCVLWNAQTLLCAENVKIIFVILA